MKIPEGEKVTNYRVQRLEPELPGILNWALEGLKAYLRDGCLKPAIAVLADRNSYRQEMDLVGQWLTEQCVIEASTSASSSDLYTDYVRFAKTELGMTWALSMTKFGRELEERGFFVERRGGGKKYRKGLRLRHAVVLPGAVLSGPWGQVNEPSGSKQR